MMRRSTVRVVHLFSALVPHASASGPPVLTPEELTAAQAALSERAALFASTGVDLAAPLRVVADAAAAAATASTRRAHEQREAAHAFSACVDAFRAELYKRTCRDAEQRLQLHEAIMAAGFYQRAISPSELAGEAMRFVLHHYNFDVRRDVAITKRVHQYLHDVSHKPQPQQQQQQQQTQTQSPQLSSVSLRTSSTTAEQLLRDLLLLERRLFGKYRFTQMGGHRWLALGQPLSELTNEAELRRLLALPAVAQDGNLVLREADVVESKGLWKTMTLAPGAESQASMFEAIGLHTATNDADLQYELRAQKPPTPKEFWERVRERLLRYWVAWLTLWLMFWAVDEEVIALTALIVLKYKQMQLLEREAQQTGGKVYVARSQPRFNAEAK